MLAGIWGAIFETMSGGNMARSMASGLAAGVLGLAVPGFMALAAMAAPDDQQPERGTGRASVTLGAESGGHMISAANPHAARAGAEILAAGGSAVDAAIAAQLMLNLVEPQSSGIGGGAFMLVHDAARGETLSYDGRETAPAAARGDQFIGADGAPMGYFDAAVGGHAVGVPGVLAMLEMAHRAHGRLPWADLFAPAIALAEAGFAISPRLHRLAEWAPHLNRFPATAAYFLGADGMPKPAGTMLRNPALAESFRALARLGSTHFYRGALAGRIAAAVQSAAFRPAQLSTDDLAGYRPLRREPVCLTYRATRVCGMAPPSSGGLTVLQILGMLAHYDLSVYPPMAPEAVHFVLEASRLAYADRDHYIADPDFVPVPTSGMLAPAYLAGRAAMIDPSRARPDRAPAGVPSGAPESLAPVPAPELPSTSHLSVIDDDGNAVALTTSVEFVFGSGILVGGFVLNNQLTDFAFKAVDEHGRPAANRLEPGKRPRSSMAPTLVYDADGRLLMTLGSPGGSRIICYVTKILVAVIDWRIDLQTAINLPNFCNRNGDTDIEEDAEADALAEGLAALGHTVNRRNMNSGVHAVITSGNRLIGGVDPRREGAAAGR